MDHYKPSVEYRKSLDDVRPPKFANGGIAGRRSFDDARMEPIAQAPPSEPEQQSRKSLEHDIQHEHAEEGPLAKFPKSEGLTTAQAEDLLRQYGRNELPEKVTPKWQIFLMLLIQPMPAMIWIAAIVEGALGNYIDTIILVAINLINASLSFYETTKAGDAVAALKASLKPTTTCMRDGKWNSQFDARLLVPGDLIELCAGNAVPADCMVNHGQLEVDESAMTGESLPVTIHEREMAKMGGTVARGETHCTVVLTGKDTFFGKTASLLGGSENKSNLQKLLLRVMIILCVLAFLLCGTALIYLLLTGNGARESLSFAVVVIVASIPMAIEIVTTTTLAIGSKTMSKFGAIVSRLAAIEDLAGLTMLCSDKTGTLTKNKMVIQDDAPTYEPGLTQMDLLKQSTMAAKWESPPKDALDTMVLRCPLWYPGLNEALAQHVQETPGISQADKDAWVNHQLQTRLNEAMADYQSLAFMPFDPRVKRTEATIKVKSSGKIFRVTKGAPHILCELDADKEKAKRVQAKVTLLGGDGIRAMAIAVSDPITDKWQDGNEEANKLIPTVWHVTGLLTFLDPPRDDTKATIAKSQHYGVPGTRLLFARMC
jgi:H+-transporting ATPase